MRQSSSRKNFQQDIETQLAFIPLQISSHFLQPLEQALDQLQTTDLKTQMRQLPASAAQMEASTSR